MGENFSKSGPTNSDFGMHIPEISMNHSLNRMVEKAFGNNGLDTRQGCEFQQSMNGKSVGEQLDIIRDYQKESKNDSKFLPPVDLKMDQDGRGYELKAKPNPEENSNKGNRSETIAKYREDQDGNVSEQSCKNMPLKPEVEKNLMQMPNAEGFGSSSKGLDWNTGSDAKGQGARDSSKALDWNTGSDAKGAAAKSPYALVPPIPVWTNNGAQKSE